MLHQEAFMNAHRRCSLTLTLTLVSLLMSASCADRAADEPTSSPEGTRYAPCEDGTCDGVGNINGEVDWIEPSEVEDPALLSVTRASGMIRSGQGSGSARCSATLISPDLILTNQHCVPDAETARGVMFFPETEREVSGYQRLTRRFACTELIATSCAHDVSILRCQAEPRSRRLPGEVYGYVNISLRGAYPGDAINLVHTNCDYREGEGSVSCTPYKLISPGQVLDYGPRCVRFGGEKDCNNCRSEANHATHNADSLGGSSGGGIFDAATHELIGVNWGGVAAKNQTDAPNYLTTMRDLAEREPEFGALFEALEALRPEEPPSPGPSLVEGPASEACARISGYLEGEGFDKAVMVTSCQAQPIPSASLGLCLEANGSHLTPGNPCEQSVMLSGELDALMEAPWAVCHSDISELWSGRCDQLSDRGLNFNGDDRVLLFHDLDGDQSFTMGRDAILDWVGTLGRQPNDRPWADTALFRRDLSPSELGEDGSLKFEARSLSQARALFQHLPSDVTD